MRPGLGVGNETGRNLYHMTSLPFLGVIVQGIVVS